MHDDVTKGWEKTPVQRKEVGFIPLSWTPSVLAKVEGDKVVQPETTPAAKNKRSESPKPSASKKKSSSSRPSTDDLKKLDDKWAERFSHLEAMLSFTVPVVKPAAEVTTSYKPCFYPGASTSSLARETSGSRLVQAIGRL